MITALFSILIIIRNHFLFLEQQIRIISEGSCDIEDCWKLRFAITGINIKKVQF